MKEFNKKSNDHQALLKEMNDTRVREADLVKRIGDLEIKNNTLEKNLYHVHAKTMPCMNT